MSDFELALVSVILSQLPHSSRAPGRRLAKNSLSSLRRRRESEGPRLLSVWGTVFFRFKEKGGKEKELPVHHKLEELLDEYLKATGLGTEPGSLLFPAALGKTGKLSSRPLVRTDAADMLKRRLKQAGLPAHYSPHSFRRPASRIFSRMTAPLRPLSGSPVTPTAEPRNYTTDADRRFCSKIWRGSGSEF